MPVATDEVYARVSIQGEDYRIVAGGSDDSNGGGSSSETGLSYVTDRYNTAAKLSTTVLSETEIGESIPVEVSIRDTTLFTGTIRNSKESTNARVRVEAYDAVADLKRTTLTRSYDRAHPEKIVADTLETAGVTGDVDLPRDRLSMDLDDERCDKVLGKITRMMDAAWWTTEDDVVVVTQNVTANTDAHDLQYIRDASPGKRTPAYQSVRVTGSSAVSRRGIGARHMLSSQPLVATAGEGEPEFHFRDNDIQSQRQAENVAKSLYKRLQEQQKGGWVEVVGREEIRPFDTVQLPATLGGETYLVRAVEQTIDGNDGFVTRLTLGGLIEA
jgi:hypothetical protein